VATPTEHVLKLAYYAEYYSRYISKVGSKKLHNGELSDLYSSPSIIRFISRGR
jgi:hypothetical protein